MRQLDDFAAEHGEYESSGPGEVARRRRDFRDKVNNYARSEAFRLASGMENFKIVVGLRGLTYEILPLEAAFEHDARQMPKELSQLATAKRRSLRDLFKDLDTSKLPPNERQRMELILGMADDLTEIFLRGTARYSGLDRPAPKPSIGERRVAAKRIRRRREA